MTTDFKFGTSSSKKLATACPVLQLITTRALNFSPYDFTIVWAWRGEEVQDGLFKSGASQKQWPDSTHNFMSEGKPASHGLDFAPWIDGGIPWDDTHIFAIIAGCFHAAAQELGVILRYGGDWDSDGSTKDQKLMDWGHIEVVV